VSDSDLQDARQGGLSDGEITEIVALVAHNTFTNYFNHVAQTVLDFPEVKVGTPVTA
jgi:alkylhydroperoxidase family enzyme